MNGSLPARTAAALLAVATLAACARTATTRSAAAPAGPTTVPVTIPDPVTTPAPVTIPAPVTTPVAGPIAPAPTPMAPMPELIAGAYVRVTGHDTDSLYRLAPGATAWTKFADLSAPQAVTAWSPDGTRVLVEDGTDGSLWSAAADGTGSRLVVRPPAGHTLCNEGFSGGSDRIWYGLVTNGTSHLALYTARPDGTDRRVVPGATTYQACWPALSADGSTVAFTRDYVAGLPAREYHEIQIATGAKHREVTLDVPAKVHIDLVLALSADGSHAVVGGMHTRPDGSCGGGDDIWYLADLRTGRAVQLAAPHGATFAGGVVFDASGRVLADAYTEVKNKMVYSVAVFDASGRYLRELAQPSGVGSAVVRIWTTVA